MAETAQQLVDEARGNEIRIQAYFREFNWLERYVKPEKVGSVKISRINGDMISSGSRVYKILQSGDGRRKYIENWFLIDHKGDLCCQVGEIVHKQKPNYKWWRLSTWGYTEWDVHESLSDALVRLGDKSRDVAFVLVLQPQETAQHIRIHKSPKNFTLTDWVGQLHQQAENALRQEIEAVEKEVKKEVGSV